MCQLRLKRNESVRIIGLVTVSIVSKAPSEAARIVRHVQVEDTNFTRGKQKEKMREDEIS